MQNDIRDRLVELLEEAKLKAHGTLGSMNNGFGAWYADHLITNDVVPVVRCKDCKCLSGEINQCGDVYCNLHQGWFDKDAFCSYGERKCDSGNL